MSATTNPRPASDVEALFSASLREVDPEIADAIKRELGRQRDEIELIASENIVSRAVLEAQGSVLTNKYAEGLPGKRMIPKSGEGSVSPTGVGSLAGAGPARHWRAGTIGFSYLTLFGGRCGRHSMMIEKQSSVGHPEPTP